MVSIAAPGQPTARPPHMCAKRRIALDRARPHWGSFWRMPGSVSARIRTRGGGCASGTSPAPGDASTGPSAAGQAASV